MLSASTCPGIIVTGTGTGVGKTLVSRGLARGLTRAGLRVAALKPFETGVLANPEDASALARAARRPELAHAPGLYRAPAPVSPFAATLLGHTACEPAAVADSVRAAVVGSDVAVVEGVGGIAVPLTPTLLFADFAALLGWPILLVARDELGVLSLVLTALEFATQRSLAVELVALGRGTGVDVSTNTNVRVLTELRPTVPTRGFEIHPGNSDDELADRVADLLDRLSLHLTGRATEPPSPRERDGDGVR